MKTRIFLSVALFLALGLFLAGGNASSADKADLDLVVTVNPVVQNAQVKLYDSSNSLIDTQYTNASGIAVVSPKSAGYYSISISASGYDPGCLNNYYFNSSTQYVTVGFGWVCGD